MNIERLAKSWTEAAESYTKLRDVIEVFDEEEKRGLVHNESYCKLIQIHKDTLPRLKKIYDDLDDEYTKALALIPYDPDNHKCNCGCVIEKGRRTVWCGDHY